MSRLQAPLPPFIDQPDTINVHACCVAFDGRAVLIEGPSGVGKSELAMQMMGLGARLVADDRTIVTQKTDGLWASVPVAIAGMIEVRGIGLLMVEPVLEARLALAVDLARLETDRLPPVRQKSLLGQTLPLLYNIKSAAFPAAILQYLKGGRCA